HRPVVKSAHRAAAGHLTTTADLRAVVETTHRTAAGHPTTMADLRAVVETTHRTAAGHPTTMAGSRTRAASPPIHSRIRRSRSKPCSRTVITPFVGTTDRPLHGTVHPTSSNCAQKRGRGMRTRTGRWLAVALTATVVAVG